jgi:predicted AAA+ superfamily ATPase
MYIARDIDKELLIWKNSKNRKPLLLRGARQVGKTSTVRNLAKHFEYFLEINFESDRSIHTLFEGDLSIPRIMEDLSAIYNIPLQPGKTLLFLDEIQSCLPALQTLRYFYEKVPGLHVIAAGSLLEFAMSQIPSFGVGRIRSLYMYPLSFNEFLTALGEEKLILLKKKADPEHPLSAPLHDKLTGYLVKFILLGGMPEVISVYLQSHDIPECLRVMDDLMFSFYDDFAKYKARTPAGRIREVFDAVILQATKKFVYAKAPLQANYPQIKDALQLLIQAGLVIPVKHFSANGLPLGAEVNPRRQKMLIFDTGIYLRLLDLDIRDLLLSKDLMMINKGNVAEMFTGLEWIKYQSPYEKTELYYWHREARNSNAEIDYLFPLRGQIIPVEVKAGTKGAMKSMFIFLKEKKRDHGVRISLENFSSYGKIIVIPLYAIDWLINNPVF